MTELPNGAIGHTDDREADGSFKYKTLAPVKVNGEDVYNVDPNKVGANVVDGPTGFIFPNIEVWREHISPASGTVPTDPEYLRKTTTPNFDEIAAGAQERGAQ